MRPACDPWSATEYDDRGRAFRSSTFSINPVSGGDPTNPVSGGDPTAGLTDQQTLSLPALRSDSYYDSRGDVIAARSPGGLWAKTECHSDKL